MPKKKNDLQKLDKGELIDLVQLLMSRVSTLEKRVRELEKSDKSALKKTSHNSSIPPSRDQKVNQAEKPKAKRGPKRGHQGTSRRRTEPDEIIECRVKTCQKCGTDLSYQPQWVVGRHQVIDLPPIRPLVREARRYRVTCPNCHCQQTAHYVKGFEKGRMFGSNLEQVVLYLHYAHPLGYERVTRVLLDLFGLTITPGALVNMVHRSQSALQHGADSIRQQIKQAPVIGSDETSARVDGTTYWQWVFQTPRWVYSVIRPSRAAQVITDVMDDAHPDVWVSDVFSSQMCHPATDYQICLAHQIRDLQYVIDAHQCDWAHQMQTLFYNAIDLHHQRHDLGVYRFATQRDTYQRQLDELLQVAPDYPESETMRARFTKHRCALLLFLYRKNVPPTNNASEQALRNSVIYRKVTGGFRSSWGPTLYANLISILETTRRQQRPIFDTLAAILDERPAFSTPHSL